jgi:hypothetical protein
MREGLVGGWRRLHNEELRNVYGSPNVIRMIKSKRVRWTSQVARLRKMRFVYKILAGKTDNWEDVGVDEKIILDSLLEK